MSVLPRFPALPAHFCSSVSLLSFRMHLPSNSFIYVSKCQPRGEQGRPNSYAPIPENYTLYPYDPQGTARKFDMLFSNLSDRISKIEGIYAEISAGIIGGESDFRDVRGWDGLQRTSLK